MSDISKINFGFLRQPFPITHSKKKKLKKDGKGKREKIKEENKINYDNSCENRIDTVIPYMFKILQLNHTNNMSCNIVLEIPLSLQINNFPLWLRDMKILKTIK